MNGLQVETWGENYAKVVERAWNDPDFKAKLLSDPASVLAEVGIELPARKNFKVVENTADTVHLVLPSDPAEEEFTDADLEQVAMGQDTCRVTPCCGEPPSL